MNVMEPLTPAHGPPVSSQTWTGVGNGPKPRTSKDLDVFDDDLENKMALEETPCRTQRQPLSSSTIRPQPSKMKWKRVAKKTYQESDGDYEDEGPPSHSSSPPKRKKQKQPNQGSDPLEEMLELLDTEVVPTAKPQLPKGQRKSNARAPNTPFSKQNGVRRRKNPGQSGKAANDTKPPRVVADAETSSNLPNKPRSKPPQKRRRAKEPYQSPSKHDAQPPKKKPRGIHQSQPAEYRSDPPSSPAANNEEDGPSQSRPDLPLECPNDPIEISSCSSSDYGSFALEELANLPDTSNVEGPAHEPTPSPHKEASPIQTRAGLDEPGTYNEEIRDSYEPALKPIWDKYLAASSPSPDNSQPALPSESPVRTPALVSNHVQPSKNPVSWRVCTPAPEPLALASRSDPFGDDDVPQPTEFTAQLLGVTCDEGRGNRQTLRQVKTKPDREHGEKLHIVGDAMMRALTADRSRNRQHVPTPLPDSDRHANGRPSQQEAEDSSDKQNTVEEWWKSVTEPSVRDLAATMSSITKKIVRFFVSEQTATKDVVDEYEKGGRRAIHNVTRRHESERKQSLHAIENQKLRFIETCRNAGRDNHAAAKKLASIDLASLSDSLKEDNLDNDLRKLRDEYKMETCR
ncbi:uncharacterized protein E0L32_003796 [Thyridium curvatum]|uniref:Uncharacterized protein n=1 Tax=Thyridium curvatum TaxID=1093900 RepID=A0A507B2K0_9PEZI|nr:uncharacterized protein E0L32_003796 [Thyridium curvatum]TPX16502.1 hypothetical protein E0L32_003796 [Thyridium curvatum]